MEKTYDPQQIEQRLYQQWEQAGYFAPSGEGAPYCIMLPPPNVTGTLHMGHGFQVTLMDTLIRYHRLCGHNTLWQAGTDHAGIATQIVVERQLSAKGIKREDLGREAFLEHVWQWKNQSDGTIKNQLRRMGASLDWTRERFSLDEDINRAVIKVFVDLYEQGLIYKGKRLVNWDPTLLTAISDLEVIAEEEEGFIWHLRYPLLDSNESLIVATTRPETLLGDTAVAVHPNDPRYQHLIGQQLRLPLTDRVIPIIADAYVDPEFGSGCVKITPAHDFNDYAMGQRHGLALINIFTPNACLNTEVPAVYQGMTRAQARAAVLHDLEKLELLVKKVPHTLHVPRGEKSNAIIEPYLTDQWYIRAKPLADAALAVVKNAEITFIPENWTKTYYQWLENIQDWCISRQLWWGHRIPVWYDAQGNSYVAETMAAVYEKYHLNASTVLTQDTDVLDTWFSSSLWPFATLGWPEKTPELHTFYPTNVLVTGFDILFFWVARMVMMGVKFTGQIPFKTVYITGLIRDSEGQKMSKSKGNTLDPIDLIDGIDLQALVAKRTYGLMQPDKAKKIAEATRREFPQGIAAFGTDALRFTYCALANTGRNIRFDLGRIEGYRNFCNKLWNASRYVLMNTESEVAAWGDENTAREFSLAERWIWARLQHAITQTTHALKNYRFDLAAQTLYEFAWNEYCDWYLEFSKPMLTSKNTPLAQRHGTQYTLVHVLETLLRLIHPLMPFVTEELWQGLRKLTGHESTTIMLTAYPVVDTRWVDPEIIVEAEWVKKVILTIRQLRGEMNVSPGKQLQLLVQKGTQRDRERLQAYGEFLKTLAKLTSIVWLAPDEPLPPAATGIVDQLELFIPLAGLIDKDIEMQRLEKEILKLEKELEKIHTRLQNADYLTKAPALVVEKERLRLTEIQETLNKFKLQQQRLNKLSS